MKFKYLFLAIFIFLLNACATSNYTVGKYFQSSNVGKIVKGKTTKLDLISLFGKPFSKSVVSEHKEIWLYMYSSGTSTVKNYVVSMKVDSTGSSQSLSVLLKDDVVVNYTFSKTDTPYTNTIN